VWVDFGGWLLLFFLGIDFGLGKNWGLTIEDCLNGGIFFFFFFF